MLESKCGQGGYPSQAWIDSRRKDEVDFFINGMTRLVDDTDADILPVDWEMRWDKDGVCLPYEAAVICRFRFKSKGHAMAFVLKKTGMWAAVRGEWVGQPGWYNG